MKKSLAVIAALAASFSLAAFAQDDAKAARKAADAAYKADKEACKPMKGDEHKNCMKEAKAKHDSAVKQAKAMKKEAKPSSGSSTPSPATPSTPAPSTPSTDKPAEAPSTTK
ncbi:MAG TPA: hypothetical protein VNH80_06200 [Burkholderiales bacterium]|nr:hypothetical protein [Burkholderiales bacterium]